MIHNHEVAGSTPALATITHNLRSKFELYTFVKLPFEESPTVSDIASSIRGEVRKAIP